MVLLGVPREGRGGQDRPIRLPQAGRDESRHCRREGAGRFDGRRKDVLVSARRQGDDTRLHLYVRAGRERDALLRMPSVCARELGCVRRTACGGCGERGLCRRDALQVARRGGCAAGARGVSQGRAEVQVHVHGAPPLLRDDGELGVRGNRGCVPRGRRPRCVAARKRGAHGRSVRGLRRSAGGRPGQEPQAPRPQPRLL